MAWTEVDSFVINTGSVDSGAETDTYLDDGNKHVLNEVSGTPGFDYEYHYASVPGAVTHFRVKFNGFYSGNPAHVVLVEVWDFILSNWDTLFLLPDAGADADYYSADLPAADHVSGGVVRLRIVHINPGVGTHLLYVDQIVLEDMSASYSTAAPTTTLTTAAPSTTAVPTTTLTTLAPTTAGPTTVPPSTPVPVVIDPDPIDLFIGLRQTALHYNPPMPYNEGLNTSYEVDPVEITLSVIGSLQDVGIAVEPIEITITPVFGSVSTGFIITPDPINIYISITATGILTDPQMCNWVQWSKIGHLDFTIDESNLAGKRPLDWPGCVYHIHRLGVMVAVYGANGVSLLKPSSVHFGMDTIYKLGLKNKGAFAGDENKHFFVDVLGQLFKVTEGLEKLDYSEFINPLGTVILSYDKEKDLLYICDGTSGFIYSDSTKSFGRGPATITGIGARNNILSVASAGAITTPKFEVCTDIYDLGTRKPKTIHSVEVGSDPSQFLFTSVDYRTSYKDPFKQIGWFLVNPDGKSYPKCYGVEFRFRLKSMIYEYFEVDYLKVRGHIHGFSYLDTVARTVASDGQV